MNVKTLISSIALKITQLSPLPRWERVRVRGKYDAVHPHLDPPPSRGRIIVGNFAICH